MSYQQKETPASRQASGVPEKTNSHLSERNTLKEFVMNQSNNHKPVHTTWPDAIDREVIAPLEASDAVQDAWGEFGVEAIADRVLVFDDHLRGFILTVSTEQFWNVVEDHARRPAHVPPRFRPIWEPEDGPEVPCWVADDVETEALTASAVIVPAHESEVRYNLNLSIDEGTAAEVREALSDALDWFHRQESHLDVSGAAR